jgi:hypothetical protein
MYIQATLRWDQTKFLKCWLDKDGPTVHGVWANGDPTCWKPSRAWAPNGGDRVRETVMICRYLILELSQWPRPSLTSESDWLDRIPLSSFPLSLSLSLSASLSCTDTAILSRTYQFYPPFCIILSIFKNYFKPRKIISILLEKKKKKKPKYNIYC